MLVKEKDNNPKRSFPTSSKDIYHFHPIAFVEQMKMMYYKPDIDLRPLMTFKSQTGRSDCNITCKRIMKQMGVTAEGATVMAKKYPYKLSGKQRYESYFQLADENVDRTNLVFRNDKKSKEALIYLDKALEHGHPILVGVNHTYGYRSDEDFINETTTDHYVVIVGRKFVNGVQYYMFWDVGTRYGASTEWLFELENDYKLIAKKTYKSGNKPYIITQIRRNKDENNKIIWY